MTEIGVRDQIAADIITVIERDEVLETFDSYLQERLINFTPENPEINPPTPLPCKSVQLYNFEPLKKNDAYCGGTYKKYVANVRVIVYLDPNNVTASTPTLNDLGERVENQLDAAAIEDTFPDTFPNSSVTEYEWGQTYQYPFQGMVQRVLKKVADSVIIEFTLTIKVMR